MIDSTKFTPGGWREALWSACRYRYILAKSGRYMARTYNHSDSVHLGTFDTPEEADMALYEYKVTKLIEGVKEYGLDINQGVVFEDNYLVFREGIVFNLHGNRVFGNSSDGYGPRGVFNGKYMRLSEVIATIFCVRRSGERYVAHLDGDRENINASNLFWSYYRRGAK